jgi:hypothetical protein
MSLFLFVPLCVLAIGCANVISLPLARATERARELSVRLALGSSRVQLARLLAFEVVLLGIVAGAVGRRGAHLLLKAMQPLFPTPLSVDRRVLALSSSSSPAWSPGRNCSGMVRHARRLVGGIEGAGGRRIATRQAPRAPGGVPGGGVRRVDLHRRARGTLASSDGADHVCRGFALLDGACEQSRRSVAPTRAAVAQADPDVHDDQAARARTCDTGCRGRRGRGNSNSVPVAFDPLRRLTCRPAGAAGDGRHARRRSTGRERPPSLSSGDRGPCRCASRRLTRSAPTSCAHHRARGGQLSAGCSDLNRPTSRVCRR